VNPGYREDPADSAIFSRNQMNHLMAQSFSENPSPAQQVKKRS
jgi:hypothetical protein